MEQKFLFLAYPQFTYYTTHIGEDWMEAIAHFIVILSVCGQNEELIIMKFSLPLIFKFKQKLYLWLVSLYIPCIYN